MYVILMAISNSNNTVPKVEYDINFYNDYFNVNEL